MRHTSIISLSPPTHIEQHLVCLTKDEHSRVHHRIDVETTFYEVQRLSTRIIYRDERPPVIYSPKILTEYLPRHALFAKVHYILRRLHVGGAL